MTKRQLTRLYKVIREAWVLEDYERQLDGKPPLFFGIQQGASNDIEYHKRLGEQIARDVVAPWKRDYENN